MKNKDIKKLLIFITKHILITIFSPETSIINIKRNIKKFLLPTQA